MSGPAGCRKTSQKTCGAMRFSILHNNPDAVDIVFTHMRPDYNEIWMSFDVVQCERNIKTTAPVDRCQCLCAHFVQI